MKKSSESNFYQVLNETFHENFCIAIKIQVEYEILQLYQNL